MTMNQTQLWYFDLNLRNFSYAGALPLGVTNNAATFQNSSYFFVNDATSALWRTTLNSAGGVLFSTWIANVTGSDQSTGWTFVDIAFNSIGTRLYLVRQSAAVVESGFYNLSSAEYTNITFTRISAVYKPGPIAFVGDVLYTFTFANNQTYVNKLEAAVGDTLFTDAFRVVDVDAVLTCAPLAPPPITTTTTTTTITTTTKYEQ